MNHYICSVRNHLNKIENNTEIRYKLKSVLIFHIYFRKLLFLLFKYSHYIFDKIVKSIYVSRME